ncbi:GNAT family N-acetyltransferase [Roseobacter sp. EG26]|uniref:GNAT family N-acetyltransferase n=1 Tax=Roseobacter sp. EG26 TaxID=3412477 RepID=UPI003CE5C1F1
MRDATNLHLRPARLGDAKNLAKLIDIAGEGIPSWLWSQSVAVGQSPLDVGIERARRQSGGFSYRNAILAEAFDQVAGMVLTYPIEIMPQESPDDLPDPIAPFVELEKQSVGSWFVNALAVFPEFRGLGIGTALMEEVEHAAHRRGYDRLSIQVYEQNVGAVRLYEHLGYIAISQARVRCHPCQPYYSGDVVLLEKQVGQTVF